jgi:predicted transposase/invertase (TIGR01784 family)
MPTDKNQRAPRSNKQERQQANKYDKILKENLLSALPGILKNVLDLNVRVVKPLNVELQHTRERKADFIAIVADQENRQKVLHIEFQARNERQMLNRMLEYKAMLLRKHPELPIAQYVVYLGKNPSDMITVLDTPDLFYRYQLIWTQQVDYQKFLHSEKPEEALLAVLADFGKSSSEEVAEAIFAKMKGQAETELEFQRYMEQLRILSNIRNLQPLIEILMEKMSRFFVEERDPLFKKGKLEGKVEGKVETAKQFVRNLIEDGSYDLAKIARLVGVSLEFVMEVKAEMEGAREVARS